LEHLSENTIKKAALSFFKTYYKFRPRVGKTTSTFDQETSDGIIVDGSLSFLQEDGLTFLATFEATSRETKNEVLFKIQSKVLLWDSLAVSFLLTSLVLSLGFYYDYFTVKQIGWLGSISLLIGIFGIAFLVYQYLFQWLKRYRYIYAVEQFKRYHADEQWIAIAEDVFEEPTDPNLKELKDQCVLNGFGLVVVDDNLETHVLITPSRQEVFGKKRSAMSFSNRDIAIQRSKIERFKLWWNNLSSKLTSQSSKNSLLRYQRVYWNQILLSLISLFIISGIFYKEAIDAEITYVNEEKYEKKLTEKAKSTKPETNDFVVDTPFVESGKSKAQPYILVNEEEPVDEDFTEKGGDSENSIGEYPNVEILITTLDGEIVAYECERFFNYTGTKFLIQQGVYPSIELAKKRIEKLNLRGVNANCMSTSCFTEDQSDYIVFIDFLFDKRGEAVLIAKSLQRKFKFTKGELQIRSITLQKP
jgi:hypothetical protein